MALNTIRVAAKSTPTASMIIVHGLGDSGEGWTFLPDMLDIPYINYIFPNAPSKPLTVAGGQYASQWFDVYELGNPNAKQDEKGYWNSVSEIKKLVDAEIAKGIPADRIIVGGFSQGASVSLGVAASSEKKLAGILSLSGFFAMKRDINSRLVDVNKDTPIFHGHGDVDPVINFNFGKLTAEYFKSLGFTHYEFKKYPGMAHGTNNEELANIREFILKQLP